LAIWSWQPSHPVKPKTPTFGFSNGIPRYFMILLLSF
jgi:hypothetical protein